MLVQVDGWTASGKSVLMFLLDGHPKIYSHPFHDIIQFLFNDENWEKEWVKNKDVWELRRLLAISTQYYKTESFIRQKKYVVEYSSKMHLDFELKYNFALIDDTFIKKLQELPSWNPTSILDAVYQTYGKVFYNTQKDFDCLVTMGGWKGKQNMHSFQNLYPNGKRILVKRDIKDIIAVRSGRKATDIDYRSKKSNNTSVEDLLNRNMIIDSTIYYNQYKKIAAENPDTILTVNFNDLIHRTKETLMVVCDFLGVEFHEVLLKSTFLGKPIEYNGIDYADQILDSHENLLTQKEIELIDSKAIRASRIVRKYSKFSENEQIQLYESKLPVSIKIAIIFLNRLFKFAMHRVVRLLRDN